MAVFKSLTEFLKICQSALMSKLAAAHQWNCKTKFLLVQDGRLK